ncbi:MAG: hypothetical protein U0X93_04610 [Anaerolineales bacterium]
MSKKNKKSKISPQIWVAIITTLGVVIVGLLNFPPFMRIFDSTPSPTPIPTNTTAPTLTLPPDTPIPSPFFTETYTSTLLPTEPLIPTFTFTPIPPTSTFTPTLPIGMQVKVIANPPSGKKPLKVKIDARDSFLRAPNGDIFKCRNGACSYTWYLTLPGGQPVKQTEKGGYIDFMFDKKGNYYINVNVCHGADNPTCASGGTVVIVE